MPSPNIQPHPIGNKRLFHFEDHATALLPWASMAKEMTHPPLLVTLDHHTDTNSAWLRSLFREVGRDLPAMEILRQERLSKIDPRKEELLLHALADLHHDEHIDLAKRLGILSDVVVVQHSSPEPLTEWKDRGMTVLPFDANRLEKSNGNPQAFYDQALEDEWLGPLLDSLPKSLSPWNQPFILDIDLDYFKTVKSLKPKHSSIFLRLVKKSIGITVAEEAGWVDRLWLDTRPEPGELFERLLKILKES